MTEQKTVYWDACIWIELINEADPDRLERCKNVLSLLEREEVEIWTSAFTLAEVYKRKCSGVSVALVETQDRAFEDFIEREDIVKVSVDVDVGNLARRLLRQYPVIKKPQDAVHVATCLLNNIDELHTFDGNDLLKLDDALSRLDKLKLKICLPPAPEQREMFTDDHAE